MSAIFVPQAGESKLPCAGASNLAKPLRAICPLAMGRLAVSHS